MYVPSLALRTSDTRTVARFVFLHTPFLPEHTRSSIVKVRDAYTHRLPGTSVSLFSLNQNSIHPPPIRLLPALLSRHLPDMPSHLSASEAVCCSYPVQTGACP